MLHNTDFVTFQVVNIFYILRNSSDVIFLSCSHGWPHFSTWRHFYCLSKCRSLGRKDVHLFPLRPASIARLDYDHVLKDEPLCHSGIKLKTQLKFVRKFIPIIKIFCATSLLKFQFDFFPQSLSVLNCFITYQSRI